jgi:hypothetical protein
MRRNRVVHIRHRMGLIQGCLAWTGLVLGELLRLLAGRHESRLALWAMAGRRTPAEIAEHASRSRG